MPFHKHKLSSRSNSESSSDSRYSNGWEYFDDIEETVKLTEFEKKAKKVFTFDKHPKYKEYNDLRIFQIQNSYRFASFLNAVEPPFIPLYSSVMSLFNRKDYEYRPERFLQRRLCSNLCNWNPAKCFLEDSHSGNLSELTNKAFHDQFNPGFKRLFQEDKTNLQLKEDKEHHPRIFELVKELGKQSLN